MLADDGGRLLLKLSACVCCEELSESGSFLEHDGLRLRASC
jgi:hypothetical protein